MDLSIQLHSIINDYVNNLVKIDFLLWAKLKLRVFQMPKSVVINECAAPVKIKREKMDTVNIQCDVPGMWV